MPTQIEIYDTTLRDGAQGPGVKFSADDQLHVVRALDAFGVHYIEGGQPGSNPKAVELFERTRDMDLKHARMAAFGSTRHPKFGVEDDPNMQALLAAQTEVVTIFAKSWRVHAEEVLGVTLEENLTLVEESVAYLKSQNKMVILDAEHFFDGFFDNREYALSVLEAGHKAGADRLVLCDTNGGRLPHQIAEAAAEVCAKLPEAQVGAHTHNDGGCAAANTIEAVRAGATHIQGTINGYGERTGNADLCTVIPGLQIKLGYRLVTDEQLTGLTAMSHLVAELANMAPRDHAPYVGRDAFYHKGGMHADAVRKLKASYEHIEPELVGNMTHIAVSEVSGRSSLIQKAREFNIELERGSEATKQILERVKELENRGYEFEGADASLELIMRQAMGEYRQFFETKSFNVRVNKVNFEKVAGSEATVKVSMLPAGPEMHTVAEGDGPVDALNNALRKALEPMYPEIKEVHLEDYKVRIIDGKLATRAMTRVLIESSDSGDSWYTVGVSENIITASYLALADSFAYKLLRSRTLSG